MRPAFTLIGALFVTATAALNAANATPGDGELLYNQENVLLPDLVICQPSVAARVLQAIAGL